MEELIKIIITWRCSYSKRKAVCRKYHIPAWKNEDDMTVFSGTMKLLETVRDEVSSDVLVIIKG